MSQLRTALCRDADPTWAMWGALQPTKAVLEELVKEAKAVEDLAAQAARDKRRSSWREWCSGQSSGRMKSLYRYTKNGPAAAVQLGLWTSAAGETFAGKHALLQASEEAWYLSQWRTWCTK